MTPGAFCPFCGAPATVVGARFCNACGRDMTGGTAPAEGATLAVPGGSPAAPAAPTAPAAAWPGMAGPGYGAPGYGAPGYGAPGYGAPGYGAPGYGAPAYAASATAPVVMVQAPKSAGIAVLLELLLSGAGSLYLGRIGQGLSWLFGTFIGGAIAGAIASYAVSSSVSCSGSIGYDYACGPDFNEIVSAYLIIGILAVAWLVARIVIVVNQSKAMATGQTALVYNGNGMLIAQQTPPSKLAVNRTQMIGLGIGLAVLTFLLVLVTEAFLPFYRLGPINFYIAAAYLLAIRRLSQASWIRTALEAGLVILGLEVVWQFVWPGLLRYGYSIGVSLVYALVGIVVSVLIGAAFAQWSVPWSALRALHPSSTNQPFGLYAVIVVVGVLIVWGIAALLDPPYGFVRGLQSGPLGLIPSLAIIVMAIVEANRLKRLTESAA